MHVVVIELHNLKNYIIHSFIHSFRRINQIFCLPKIINADHFFSALRFASIRLAGPPKPVDRFAQRIVQLSV